MLKEKETVYYDDSSVNSRVMFNTTFDPLDFVSTCFLFLTILLIHPLARK